MWKERYYPLTIEQMNCIFSIHLWYDYEIKRNEEIFKTTKK
ncbi:hypothetical protein C2W64_01844 [Brevibacillus laterosporus]|nr:hypothetical protein C2W64_01844 [Brevibacillus laterosporus]